MNHSTFTLPAADLPTAEPVAPATLTCADGHQLPLRSVDVAAQVDHAHGVALVVEQRFANDRSEPVEVTYTFPLPARFAVLAMTATLAGRTVTAQLAERQAARDIYDHAISSGVRAALAEQDRDEVFTLTLGNVAPGEEVRCRLELVGVAALDAGSATLRLPLVVAPRFTPGTPLDGTPAGTGTAADTDAAPDASRVTPPRAAGPLGVAVTATVELPEDAASTAVCSTHISAAAEVLGEGRTKVTLTVDEPDCDAVIRWADTTDGAAVATLDADHDGADGTEILTLTVTPQTSPDTVRRPLDVVVLLDRSGSMHGWKMVAARRAAARIADACSSKDRLAVWAFDSNVEHAPGHDRLESATDARRFAATSWLGQLEARGGTQLAPALASATALLGTPAGRDAVLVLITDAQVSDEDRCVRSVSGAARVLVVGVDDAANGSLCDRLARATGGWSDTVESPERLDEALPRLQRAVAAPAWVAPRLIVEGAEVLEQAPAVIPDGYADAPFTLRARVRRTAEAVTASLISSGRTVAVADAHAGTSRAAAPLFARTLLADLEDSHGSGRDVATGIPVALDAVAARLVEVSLAYGVLCRHTAFVAVDPAAAACSDGAPLPVVQPVAQPRSLRAAKVLRGVGSALSHGISVGSSQSQGVSSSVALAMNLDVGNSAPGGAASGSLGVAPSYGVSVSQSVIGAPPEWDRTSAPHLYGNGTSLPVVTTWTVPGTTPAEPADPPVDASSSNGEDLVLRAEQLAKRLTAAVRTGRPTSDQIVVWAGEASQVAVALATAGDPAPKVRAALEELAAELNDAAVAFGADRGVAVHLERLTGRAAALTRVCGRHRSASRSQFWRA